MHKKVLVLEEEALIALHEQKIIEKYGFEVHIALSGEDAVAAAKNHSDIVLILMDIDLGWGISGIEAATRVLQQRG